MNTHFSFKKMTLTLLLLTFGLGEVGAILTKTKRHIQGEIPKLKNKNNQDGVDLSTTATDNFKIGDELILSYRYSDPDGDEDDSTTTVKWYSIINGETKKISTSHIKNKSANSTGNGESKLEITSATEGASNFKVSITATSKSGDPNSGESFVINDIFKNPYGDSISSKIEKNLSLKGSIAGIYDSEDKSFSKNLINEEEQIKVGRTYVFRLWSGADKNVDLTSKVKYEWRLLGQSASDNITAPPEGFKTKIFNRDFIVPNNEEAKKITNSKDGAQGFNLAVDWK
ncbi:hypothetical protein [Candidatus Hamiltonella defensa]|uniref:hypothetical protein n=1 Tax=Candidatus Williamhamiltonella defendens TaxID=138072 RepID=UPI0015822FD7|nr:hypothetical protein [Candidatus Hamiltonella defensa]